MHHKCDIESDTNFNNVTWGTNTSNALLAVVWKARKWDGEGKNETHPELENLKSELKTNDLIR